MHIVTIKFTSDNTNIPPVSYSIEFYELPISANLAPLIMHIVDQHDYIDPNIYDSYLVDVYETKL